MNRNTPTRSQVSSARTCATQKCLLALALGFTILPTPVHALGRRQSGGNQSQSAPQQRQAPAPIVRVPPGTQPRATGESGLVTAGHPRQSQQHLAAWMDSHRNLSLDQQQHALEAEPGFRQLQPDVQARMHNRLTQLNSMSPGQRERTIARTEAMERLAPEQRQEVRSALSSLGALPEDRRRLVARTFRSLRDLPDLQRQQYLNSPQVRAQFSEPERVTLLNLIHVSPYLPPPPQPQPQAYPR